MDRMNYADMAMSELRKQIKHEVAKKMGVSECEIGFTAIDANTRAVTLFVGEDEKLIGHCVTTHEWDREFLTYKITATFKPI